MVSAFAFLKPHCVAAMGSAANIMRTSDQLPSVPPGSMSTQLAQTIRLGFDGFLKAIDRLEHGLTTVHDSSIPGEDKILDYTALPLLLAMGRGPGSQATSSDAVSERRAATVSPLWRARSWATARAGSGMQALVGKSFRSEEAILRCCCKLL